jgi:N-acetylglutamate synthase-like GNAT family acetyltransferase
VGFARLITDSATFAYLADVYILEKHRGNGLSKQMMQQIIDHSQLQGLRRIMLATKDAHGLYEQYGFTALTDNKMFMQLCTPDIYTQAS